MFFATCTIAFRNELWNHTFIIGKKTLNYTVTWRKQRKPNSFVWLPIKTNPFSFFSESRKLLLQHSRDILHVHLHVLAYQLEDDSIFSNVHGKIELSQKISSSYVWLLQVKLGVSQGVRQVSKETVVLRWGGEGRRWGHYKIIWFY